jgi:ABC-2 type transport system ATP-binding protein
MGIIETEQLTRRYGTVTAVNSLTISVNAGEVFGMLGPNGAGKTTVIKILTTLLAPTSGRATVAGFDVAHQGIQVRRRVGYVPQMLSADGTLTGYESLLVFARLYDIPRRERDERIHEALAFMDLRRSGTPRANLLGRHDSSSGDCAVHAAPARGAVSRRAHARP